MRLVEIGRGESAVVERRKVADDEFVVKNLLSYGDLYTGRSPSGCRSLPFSTGYSLFFV